MGRGKSSPIVDFKGTPHVTSRPRSGDSMADEKKPKIDLKARLGKASTATPPPGTVIPVPVPKPTASRPPPPGGLGGGLPGVPIGPPSPFGSQPPPIDPSNPLAAVAQVYRPPPPSAPAP